MTKVTFLIGNGFDLNVGLHTKYKHFYDYLTKEYPYDFLASVIRRDYNYWSDLEEGIGKYTEKVREIEEDAFIESEQRLTSALADYLKSQMEKVDLRGIEREIATDMIGSLVGFYREFSANWQHRVDNILNSSNGIIYSFITYNYTNVLEQCLDAAKKSRTECFKMKNPSGRMMNHTINNVLHIHGTTTDGQMVLGVNDENQIRNKEFRKIHRFRIGLIKEVINKTYENVRIEEARGIIDDSGIIFVFGMSVGKTDRMWWQYICRWLEMDSKRILIIHAKMDEGGEPWSIFECREKTKRKLKNGADLNDEEWSRIENQIYIDFSKEIFSFKRLKKRIESE